MPTPTPVPVPSPDAWAAFWVWATTSGLGITIVGTVIAAAIISLSKRLRDLLWSGLVRAGSFVKSIRVTTTKRLRAFEASALEAGRQTAEAEMAAKRTMRDLMIEQQVERALAGGQAVPPPPAPQATWSMTTGRALSVVHQQGRLLRLTNHTGGAEALNVRVEADGTRIGFPQGAHWASLPSGESRDFIGVPTGVIGDGPLVYTIRWREEGYEHSRQVVPTPRMF